MTTLLRKRHAHPSVYKDDRHTSSQHSSKKRRNSGQNYGLIALYCAIFLSSPILLLLATRLPRVKHKSLLPLSRNLNINDENQQQEPQSQMLLRSNTPTEMSAMKHHVVGQVRNNMLSTSDIPTVPVVVWPYIDYGAGTAELQHFVENGIQESSHVKMSHDLLDVSPNVVWIGDFGFPYPSNTWCNAFYEKVVEVRDYRRQHNLPLQWPIFIVDWSDQTHMPHCPQVEEIMGKEWIQYSIRNVVTQRHWNTTREWVDVGTRLLLPPNYHHIPLFVRTDTVEALDNVLRDKYNMSLASPMERLDRDVDVSHFWPLDLKGVKEVRHAKLRERVSNIISEIGNSTNLNVFVGLAGNALQAGRRTVKSDYIEAMLNSKIIVVTQRDDWDDHYRLFEALVSGAMVMTDRMLSLPQGLKNGTSIVEFDSEDDLRHKIMYYSSHDDERIEIASRGREVSMRQHRTFHRVEQVVFGRELSDCSSSGTSSSCPWIVHASEI